MSHIERVYRTELSPDRLQLLVHQFVGDIEQRTTEQHTDILPGALEQLQNVVENVNRFHSPEQRLDVLLRAFLPHIPAAHQGAIYLSAASGHTFVIGALTPSQPSLIGTETDAQGGYIEAVAQVKCPVLLPDTHQEALVEKACTVQCALVIPFIVGGKTVGVLSLENHEQTYAFSQADLDFASLLSSHTAMAVDNARLLMSQLQRGDWGAPELNVIQALAQSVPVGILVKQDQYGVWGNSAFCIFKEG